MEAATGLLVPLDAVAELVLRACGDLLVTAMLYRWLMAGVEPLPISIDEATATLAFLSNRTPTTSAEESKDAFTHLSSYRDS